MSLKFLNFVFVNTLILVYYCFFFYIYSCYYSYFEPQGCVYCKVVVIHPKKTKTHNITIISFSSGHAGGYDGRSVPSYTFPQGSIFLFFVLTQKTLSGIVQNLRTKIKHFGINKATWIWILCNKWLIVYSVFSWVSSDFTSTLTDE